LECPSGAEALTDQLADRQSMKRFILRQGLLQRFIFYVLQFSISRMVKRNRTDISGTISRALKRFSDTGR
jgi:hypothetical protein